MNLAGQSTMLLVLTSGGEQIIHSCRYSQSLPLSSILQLEMATTSEIGASLLSILSPSTRSLVYKGWLIRDAFQRLLDLFEILRDEV